MIPSPLSSSLTTHGVNVKAEPNKNHIFHRIQSRHIDKSLHLPPTIFCSGRSCSYIQARMYVSTRACVRKLCLRRIVSSFQPSQNWTIRPKGIFLMRQFFKGYTREITFPAILTTDRPYPALPLAARFAFSPDPCSYCFYTLGIVYSRTTHTRLSLMLRSRRRKPNVSLKREVAAGDAADEEERVFVKGLSFRERIYRVFSIHV